MNDFNPDSLRAQISFQEAIPESERTKKQIEWLSEKKKQIFWHQVQFETAQRILGRTPINQDEAQITVSKYNEFQCAKI